MKTFVKRHFTIGNLLYSIRQTIKNWWKYSS
jgi:hypothetical protein